MSKGPKRKPKANARGKTQEVVINGRRIPRGAPKVIIPDVECYIDGCHTMVKARRGADVNIPICDRHFAEHWAAFWRTMGVPAHKAPRALDS